MTDMKEFRALLEQGPAVALVAKDDMLRILDVLEAAQLLMTSHNFLFMGEFPHVGMVPLTSTGAQHGGCHFHRLSLLARALSRAEIDPFASEHVHCMVNAAREEPEAALPDLSTATPAGRA